MSVYDEWARTRETLAGCRREVERLRFLVADARLARMHGYRPVMAINLRGPREPVVPSGYLAAIRRAWWRIRREVWTVREAALRGERWEGIG